MLTVGLLAYQGSPKNPLESFPFTITFPNSIWPSKRIFYAEYVIGIANPPIYFPTYEIFPKDVVIAEVSVV